MDVFVPRKRLILLKKGTRLDFGAKIWNTGGKIRGIKYAEVRECFYLKFGFLKFQLLF